MHRKTSTATERLTALRALIVAIASRTGVAAVQILFATLTFVRSLRVGDLRAAGQSLVRRRQVLASIAYGSVLTLVIAAGAVALVQGDSPATPAVAVADAQNRLAAAERADRSSRADPSDAPGVAAPGEDPGAAAAQAQAAGQVLAAVAAAWVSPMPGAAVSSCYGPRWGAMHMGMDFAAPAGTPIVAAGGGTIFGVGWLYSGYGISVVIDHGNGYFTHYAHASRINVAVGQQVTAGQIVAWEGSTGDSTGPHLHFEVHQALWNQINPAQFLRERGALVGC